MLKKILVIALTLSQATSTFAADSKKNLVEKDPRCSSNIDYTEFVADGSTVTLSKDLIFLNGEYLNEVKSEKDGFVLKVNIGAERKAKLKPGQVLETVIKEGTVLTVRETISGGIAGYYMLTPKGNRIDLFYAEYEESETEGGEYKRKDSPLRVSGNTNTDDRMSILIMYSSLFIEDCIKVRPKFLREELSVKPSKRQIKQEQRNRGAASVVE